MTPPPPPELPDDDDSLLRGCFASRRKRRQDAQSHRPAHRRRSSALPVTAPEPLEQRQLLAGLQPGWTAAHEQVCQPTLPGGQLVVIDAGLASDRGIAASFGPQARILYESQTTGLFSSVSAALAAEPGISSIHLVGHGSPGRFSLGETTFDTASVDQLADGLVAWNRLAAPGADL